MSVYVIQRPKPKADGWQPDLTSASEYGKIEYVFDSSDQVYSLPAPMMKKAQNVLKNFDPENDYLLWPNTGDPAALMICCFSLGLLGFKKCKILYWNRKRHDRKYGFYAPIIFDLKNYT